MRNSIVVKWFMLTTGLCLLILAAIFIGQTLFFEKYYAKQKIRDIQTNIQLFEERYVQAGDDVPTKRRLEQDFYQNNATWITTLDHAGHIKHADDFSVWVQLGPSRDPDYSNRVVDIPLYSFIDLEELDRVKYRLEQGNRIYIDGIKKGDRVIPAIINVDNGNYTMENRHLSEKIYGNKSSEERSKSTQIYLVGTIQDLHLPEGALGSSVYANHLFLERIKQFQVNLLTNENHEKDVGTMDYVENNIHYKIFMKPTEDSAGEMNYIFAMTSLQPVDEAVQMTKEYYLYLLLFVLLLILMAAFYYSKKISKPLLQMNEITNKMAHLDFSETIPITSKDEIGSLSHNINTLSHTLHSYINQLQQDIEKEKQLEHTRKQFISSVSHELKTPLSIMKSCISILEDGVAGNKKDYYYKAMVKEVDRMNRLIVDMLELAKFESGTYKMEMDGFYIDEVIEHITEQLALDITNKQLYLHKHLSKTKVVANQLRIEQVITNFITNAIRHTPEHKSIMISTMEEEDRVKVCVENQGSRIAQEHIERIWDQFYRGDASRQRSKGGTGLGLAISKNILELHGTPYGVTNTEDGVLFYFYLQVAE